MLSNFWQRLRRRLTGISGGGTPTTSYDGDAQLFFDANTGLSSTQKGAVNALVLALKSDGIWNRMVAIYPFVGGTAAAHKWNLKDPRDNDLAFRLSFLGGWTHDASGALPNGTTGYAKTFIDVHENCPQYSFHGSFYNAANVAPGASDYFLFGGKPSGPGIQFEFYNNNSIFAYTGEVNSVGSAVTLNITGQSTWNGLFTLSTYHNNFFRVFRGTTQIGSQTTDRYGYFPNNDPNSDTGKLYISAYNNNETAQSFSPYKCSFISFGWGLNTTQVSALNTAVINLQTALSRL